MGDEMDFTVRQNAESVMSAIGERAMMGLGSCFQFNFIQSIAFVEAWSCSALRRMRQVIPKMRDAQDSRLCYTISRMKYASSSFYLYAVAILVVISLIVFAVKQQSAPAEHDAFAQCLTDHGVKMFGAWWCPHCQKQKALFGKSFEKINYIECSSPGSQEMNQTCKDAKIEGYPTWEFKDKTRVSGEQTLEDLGKKAECTL